MPPLNSKELLKRCERARRELSKPFRQSLRREYRSLTDSIRTIQREVRRENNPQEIGIDLNAVIEDRLAYFTRLYSPKFSFVWTASQNILPVALSEPYIRLALATLIRNAMEAMPKGGQVVIETSDAGEPRGFARLSVADNGDWNSRED